MKIAIFIILRYLWIRVDDYGGYLTGQSSRSSSFYESPGRNDQPIEDTDDDDELNERNNPYAIQPNWRSSIPTQDLLEVDEHGTSTNEPSDHFFMNKGYRGGDAAKEVLEDMQPATISDLEIKSQAIEHYKIYKMASPSSPKRK